MTDGPGRGWVFTLTALGAYAASVGYALRNIPPAIEGVHFVQVIPAMLLGGAVVATLDTIHLVLYRRTTDDGRPTDEWAMARTAPAIAAALVRIRIHNTRHRLGLADEDAETHYDRLAEREP